jgi:hypothetical protein
MDEIWLITQDCSIHLIPHHSIYFKSLSQYMFLGKGNGPRASYASVVQEHIKSHQSAACKQWGWWWERQSFKTEIDFPSFSS